MIKNRKALRTFLKKTMNRYILFWNDPSRRKMPLAFPEFIWFSFMYLCLK